VRDNLVIPAQKAPGGCGRLSRFSRWVVDGIEVVQVGGGVRTVRSSRRKLAIRGLWATESGVLLLAVMLAARLRFHADPQGFAHFVEGIAPRAALVALCITGAMLAFGLYQSYVRHSLLDLVLRVFLSFALGGVALLVVYYAAPPTYIGRGVLAIALAMGMAGIFVVRWIVAHLSSAQALKKRVLVYGAGNNANLINTRLRRKSDRQSFNVLGCPPRTSRWWWTRPCSSAPTSRCARCRTASTSTRS
jgi:hypothetical protein